MLPHAVIPLYFSQSMSSANCVSIMLLSCRIKPFNYKLLCHLFCLLVFVLQMPDVSIIHIYMTFTLYWFRFVILPHPPHHWSNIKRDILPLRWRLPTTNICGRTRGTTAECSENQRKTQNQRLPEPQGPRCEQESCHNRLRMPVGLTHIHDSFTLIQLEIMRHCSTALSR